MGATLASGLGFPGHDCVILPRSGLLQPDVINGLHSCYEVQHLAQRRGFKQAKVKVAQACLTLCDPVDYSPPGSSVLGILQARKKQMNRMFVAKRSELIHMRKKKKGLP